MENQIATARWAHPAEVEKKYAYRKGSLWLGRSPLEDVPLGYRDDRHVCLVCGSRGGKGTTAIINNLCQWPGSVVVVDPKGENATITAARRGPGSDYCTGLGQAVHVLDPFRTSQVQEELRSKFNPLDVLNASDGEAIDEAGRIADALVVIHEGNDPFWDESARSMVKGLILHVLTSPRFEGRRNLVTVRKLIMRGDWEALEAAEIEDSIGPDKAHHLLWMEVKDNEAFDGLLAGIGSSFFSMLMNSPKQYESVLQVANRNTEFIDSPAMQRSLERSDFGLSELKTRREGVSLYLCLPQRYMSTHYRWLRMMISLTVTEMEVVKGRPASGYPVLMLLDEFAGLKRMEVIENAVAQIAGFGVKLFFVLQSLEQLKATYKANWETFLANSGLKMFFNLEDQFSRDYVSKLAGETEVIRETRTATEGTSESEAQNTSTTRTQGTSRTKGSSQTRGRSQSQSLSIGTSGGSSETSGWSEGTSSSESWQRGGLFAQIFGRSGSARAMDTLSRGSNQSRSGSVTHQQGWSESQTTGTSTNESESLSESVSVNEGSSETEGSTRTQGRSFSQGRSETVHRRALIHPDEIGHLFASTSDRGDLAYPGAGLVLVAGERPMVVRRVNYFEDHLFIDSFDPHPDHPFRAASSRLLCLPPELEELGRSGHFRILGWRVGEREPVEAGEEVGQARVGIEGLPEEEWKTGSICSPFRGLIASMRDPADRLEGAEQESEEDGTVFTMKTYETDDGQAEERAFAELLTMLEELRRGLAERDARRERVALVQRQHKERMRTRRRVLVCVGVVLVAVLGWAIIFGGRGAVGPQAQLEKSGGAASTPPVGQRQAPPISQTFQTSPSPAPAVQRDVGEITRAVGTILESRLGSSLQDAASRGDAAAKMWVAVGHARGRYGLQQDAAAGSRMATEAIFGIRELAQRRDTEGLYLMGTAHRFGLGEEQSLEKAAALWEQACEGGYSIACVMLGTAQEEEEGMQQDLMKAMDMYEKGCSGGSPLGCARLAQLLDGTRIALANLERAAELHGRACEGGVPSSCYAMSRAYRDGAGVGQDPEKAAAMAKKACDWEIADGCAELGTAHYYGRGAVEDIALTFSLYSKACQMNSPTGCFNLGIMHETGRGTPRSIEIANTNYRRSCSLGFQKACDKVK